MKKKDSSCAISIDAEWVRKLENTAIYAAKTRVRHRNSGIIKVVKILRDVEPEAYDPIIVSLGPYHYHKPHLQATNQLKWFLLNKLLETCPEKSLAKYLALVKEKETKVRNAYAEPPAMDMCEKMFVEMMLLDCVFVIMILWFWKKEGLKAIEDPIFRGGQRILILLARDMLLLENQLPFFLLEALFDSAFPDKRGRLKRWLVQFFSGFVYDKMPEEEPQEGGHTVHHILHLFYLCINVPLKTSVVLPQLPRVVVVEEEEPRMGYRWLPSATRLEATGIKLKRKKKQKAVSFLDITFKKGVLEIPQMEIDDDTNILFRNLIAFEQCQENFSSICNHISTYAWFLSCIVETVADVELLQRKAIIINRLGNKKEVANLFAKLCKEVVIDCKNCYISSVFKEVAQYRQMKYVVCRFVNYKCFSNFR